MDKSRGQFEEWFSKEYEEVNNSTELSARVIKMIAWAAWQASRAAVEIDIPEGETVFSTATDSYGEDGCVMLPVETMEHVIRAAGLKVKGA